MVKVRISKLIVIIDINVKIIKSTWYSMEIVK